jgi:hypothetical protein
MTVYEGAAILGALAWIPYLFKLVRETITRPEVRIITQRTAEIGFTTLGPILNLRIAFSVRYRDVVISSIKLKVIHESGEERILSWQGIVQRLGQMQTPQVGPIPWEKEQSVLAIKLSEKEVEERFIRFQEDEYHSGKESYDSIAGKKLTFLYAKGEFKPKELLDSQEMQDVILFIKRWPSWKQGKYKIIFDVESPEKFYLEDNVYHFELDPLSVDSLEANKNLIHLSIEDQINFNTKDYQAHLPNWNWVNPTLKKAT